MSDFEVRAVPSDDSKSLDPSLAGSQAQTRAVVEAEGGAKLKNT